MLNSTALFDLPQQEIASLLIARMERASVIRIVTGFATPGGLATIAPPLKAHPQKLETLIIGAATYRGFETLDDLLAMGVPRNRLHVHLGHTGATGTRKNPYARFHPMLHSKVYYMEFPNGTACAVIGSHNVTTYALSGLNGEAAVLLEGKADDPEFDKVRAHIDTAVSQSTTYDPSMKEAYAWWTREFIEGLKAEIGIPYDWMTVRTILIFACSPNGERPKLGDQLYFELPSGIQQIESLKTETHLFLFDTLPNDPWGALDVARSADAHYTCDTLGVENQQGNKEIVAHWRIDDPKNPTLIEIPANIYRPTPTSGMQQVRAEIKASSIEEYEYLFDRENKKWIPNLDEASELKLPEGQLASEALAESSNGRRVNGWQLVKGLSKGEKAPAEKDETALWLASPDSGSFAMISLRRRQRQ